LAIPLLNGVKSTLSGEVKHEQDGNGIVTDKWEHVNELPLSSQVPNRKCNLSIANGDSLLHEINALGKSMTRRRILGV
jgi:hypothetical protein